MQSRARNQIRFWAAIEDIAQQRMAQRVSMDPDLMCSSRHGRRLDQRRSLVALQNLEVCLRGNPASVIHHSAVFMPHIYPQRKPCDLLLKFR